MLHPMTRPPYAGWRIDRRLQFTGIRTLPGTRPESGKLGRLRVFEHLLTLGCMLIAEMKRSQPRITNG